MGKTIRIALVDDHKMLLSGLAEWISKAADDIKVVLSSPDWAGLLTHPEFPVDVVLLDLDLKDHIPISLKISTLNTAEVTTVLMSAYSNPELVREALAAGAMGYVVKSEDIDVMVSAIRKAIRGERYISEELSEALSEGTASAPKLSEQERNVMALYASGSQIKVVAHKLGISQETAKSYLKRIREKYRLFGVDVGTKIMLRDRAIKDGIILAPDAEEYSGD